MIYYLDDFMTKLVRAHNCVNTDQKKAIDIIKSVIQEFKPEDEKVLYLLKSSCEVGLDSPKKFQSYIKECMDLVHKNHEIMIESYKSNKKSNGRQSSKNN
jgi:hypothetical protein